MKELKFCNSDKFQIISNWYISQSAFLNFYLIYVNIRIVISITKGNDCY